MDKVVHFEVPFDDKDRATNFYATVFGWQMQEWPQFDYTGVRTTPIDEKTMQPTEPGAINGGMSKRDPEMPYPMFYTDVKSIDETLLKIQANGGSVVRGKTPLGDMGFLAWFKDSEGNILGLTQFTRSQ